MGPYKPLRNWVDEFIPYYMEIMGVDRPDRTYHENPLRFLLKISPPKNVFGFFLYLDWFLAKKGHRVFHDGILTKLPWFMML